jgi:hypothetical protein
MPQHTSTGNLYPIDDLIYKNNGPPSSGTFAGVARTGSLLIDFATPGLYQNAGTQAAPIWTMVGAQPVNAGLTVTQLTANQVFQRTTKTGSTYGGGAGSISFSFSNTGAITALQYRLRDATTAAVLQNWTNTSTTSYAAGSHTGTYPAVPSRLGQYLIDTMPNNDPTQIVLGTSPVGMGGLTCVAGQSEAVRFFKNFDTANTITTAGITPNPYCSVYAAYTAPSSLAPGSAAWTVPATGGTYDSVGAATYLNTKSAATDVAWGVIGFGHDGTAISTWVPGQADYISLTTVIAGAGNAYEELFWFNGAGSAVANVSASAYLASMNTLFPALAATNTISNPRIVTSNEQDCNTTSGTGTFSQILPIKQAHQSFASSYTNAIYVSMPDVDLATAGNTVEIANTNSGVGRVAINWFRAAVRTTTGTYAPAINAVSVSGATVTLTMIAAAGTGFVGVGAWWTRFAAFPSGTLTGQLTFTGGSIVNGNTVTLTASASISGAIDVYYGNVPSGQQNNSAVALYDNYTSDGFSPGYTILTSGTAVSSGSATPTLTVTTPTGAIVGAPTFLYGTASYAVASLNYRLNGGASTAVTNLSVTSLGGGNYQWIGQCNTFGATATGQVIQILDGTTSGITVSTNAFAVVAAPSAATSITLVGTSFNPTGGYGSGALNASAYGTLPSSVMPASGSTAFTFEAYGKSAAAQSYVQSLFGGLFASSGNGYAGEAADGTFIGGVFASTLATSSSIVDNVRHHIAIQLNGSTATLWLDGVLKNTLSVSGTYTPSTFGVKTFGATPTASIWVGEMDSLRISNVAQYSGNFTPTPGQCMTGAEPGVIGFWPLLSNGSGVTTNTPVTISVPSGLGYTPTWTTTRQATGQITTSFSPTALIPTITTQYYVDPVNGLDTNNGTSSGTAFKTLSHALVQGTAGTTIGIQLVLSANYVALGTAAWNNTQPVANVVVTNPSGYRFISTQTGSSTTTTWTQNGTYSNVYQVAKNFNSVVDLASPTQPSVVIPSGQRLTVNGTYVTGDGSTATTITQCGPVYKVYTIQTSIANVAANPGSSYYDGTNTYVSTPTGRAADANVIGCANANNGRGGAQNNQFTYVENVDFVGGSCNFYMFNASTVTGQVYVFNVCSFQGSSNSNNNFSVQGFSTVYTQNCLAAYGQEDGFNYHSYEEDGTTGTSPNFHEFGNVAIGNGFNLAPSSNNCTTCHDYCVGTRINGIYVNSTSVPIAETNNAKTWNVGCFIGPSTSNASSYNVNDAALINAQQWLDSCVIAPAISPNYQVYVNTTATMNIATNMPFPTWNPSGGISPVTYSA